MVAIDQYAEAATGNRSYFLDKPHSIGGSRRNSDVPQALKTCGKSVSRLPVVGPLTAGFL